MMMLVAPVRSKVESVLEVMESPFAPAAGRIVEHQKLGCAQAGRVCRNASYQQQDHKR
jgi:hypothetical protein